MPTLPPPVTDTDLDRPDIRAAARAVVDDLATAGDLQPAGVSDPHRPRTRRLAVAAAAAAVAVGAGVGGYTLMAGGGPAESDVTAPAAAPAQASPPAPADVCQEVTAWLDADAGGDDAGAEVAFAQLVSYRDRALHGDDSELARRIEVLMAAIQTGDRLAAETAASEGFGGDACT
jgi:hypothetical protein